MIDFLSALADDERFGQLLDIALNATTPKAIARIMQTG
jgi:hypothetical protein